MKLKIIVLMFSFLSISGCLKSDVYFTNYTPDQEIQITDEMHHQRLSFFGFGYWPERQLLRASSLCPKGRKVSRILTETGFVDGLLAAITLEIYTPKSVYSACARDPKHEP